MATDGSSSGQARILRAPDHRAITGPFTASILRLVPDSPSVPAGARNAILAWYAANGRRLAFRRTTDPYAVLASEAMAQQTQAARAAEHWDRWMARFPTVAALAAATPADVLRQWQGLGYNRRALALWRAARVINDEYDGHVPDSVEALERLPGVGRYTARAVAAIAFGRPVGAVDVNVRRVLARLTTSEPAALSNREIQQLADDAVPPDQPAAWTHAVMDIGATLCRPRGPRCEDCPARPWCRYATGGGVTADVTATRNGTGMRPRLPFSSTNRWLRGRILDRLRAVPDDRWVTIDGPVGTHDIERVRAAANALAADGLVELLPSPANGKIRARLTTV
jgi:A/G-specific adenine glycosylase